MKNIISILLLAILFSSCAQKRTIDVKSPCVSLDDGPCGPKKSINDWWIKNNA